ncbi:hypothetical protein DFH06DRAFT_1239646 [Mycena polygramma]|nr:hypothetical protein DFH06DRAFT_1239646 [Mycena polygramma]
MPPEGTPGSRKKTKKHREKAKKSTKKAKAKESKETKKKCRCGPDCDCYKMLAGRTRREHSAAADPLVYLPSESETDSGSSSSESDSESEPEPAAHSIHYLEVDVPNHAPVALDESDRESSTSSFGNDSVDVDSDDADESSRYFNVPTPEEDEPLELDGWAGFDEVLDADMPISRDS